MPVQIDILPSIDVPTQANVCTPVPSQPTAFLDPRDVPARGDYEAVAKCTRSVSSHSFARLVKISRHSLTNELAKELSSP